jgi:purine-binding chemotaxis protein CheW
MVKEDVAKNLESSAQDSFDDDEEDVKENKFLTFCLGQEVYGIGIEYVMEIIRVIRITPMPEMYDFLKGVVNLRGKVIPVMDVRLRFGLQERAYDDRTCIVVVKIQDLEIGLIVDTVAEVLEIPEGQIEPPPKMHMKSQQKYIMGIGKTGDEVKILLDLSKLLFEEEIQKIANVGGGVQ